MIGYYIHHVGRGHLRRAQAIAEHLAAPVTGLSSLPRPAAWRGGWVQLALDHGAARPDGAATPDGAPHDPQAGGGLHWAPLGHVGLRGRMAAISAWIEHARPRLVVVDVSVEVALLARLHGVRVASVVQPGERGDPAHKLGHQVSTVLLAAWPQGAAGMASGLDPWTEARIEAVGAVSAQPISTRPSWAQAASSSSAPSATAHGRPRVLVLAGAGGSGFAESDLARAQSQTAGWRWDVIGGARGRWVHDVATLLRAATVVVAHAGQGALADVSAARTPAIVIPQARPHAEQLHTARHLERSGRYPAVVRWDFPHAGWQELLDRAASLDGGAWSLWNDGGGAARAAAAIASAVQQ